MELPAANSQEFNINKCFQEQLWPAFLWYIIIFNAHISLLYTVLYSGDYSHYIILYYYFLCYRTALVSDDLIAHCGWSEDRSLRPVGHCDQPENRSVRPVRHFGLLIDHSGRSENHSARPAGRRLKTIETKVETVETKETKFETVEMKVETI